jgi:hypothetical protein
VLENAGCRRPEDMLPQLVDLRLLSWVGKDLAIETVLQHLHRTRNLKLFNERSHGMRHALESTARFAGRAVSLI